MTAEKFSVVKRLLEQVRSSGVKALLSRDKDKRGDSGGQSAPVCQGAATVSRFGRIPFHEHKQTRNYTQAGSEGSGDVSLQK